MSCTSLFDVYLAGFFSHPKKPERTSCILYFLKFSISGQKVQFQDKRYFFQIQGVFQDQDQIQGLFQVCANPGEYHEEHHYKDI